MKKVITMAGTSIFENYLENNRDVNFGQYYEQIKEKRSREWNTELVRIDYIKTKIGKWVQSQRCKSNVSAEVKSLIMLKKELNDSLEIYLLCSDTILSKLAGEVIKELLLSIQDLDITNDTDIKIEIIKDLQVWDRKDFKNGLEHLVDVINKASSGFWDNVVINITGGFKASIPYLTVLGQIYRCPLYYIFENTEELICIEPGPISVDWGLFEKYVTLLNLLSNGVYDLVRFRSQYSKFDQFYSELKSIVWLDEKSNLAELNPLGKIFWEFYIQHIPVYITRESEYFRFPTSDKKRIHNAILELYERLEKVLKGINSKEEAIRKIVELTEKNDLRHGPVIDGKEGVFIFKSTNEEHIRLLYSFNVSEGRISSISIYDFKYRNFAHDEYIQEFKDKYDDLKNIDKICIPIKKEV